MNLVTRPDCQGIGTALLPIVLHTLRAEGIPVASLNATAAGQGIYEASGFGSSDEWIVLLR